MYGRTRERTHRIGTIARVGFVAAMAVGVIIGSQPQATFAADNTAKHPAIDLKQRPDRKLTGLDQAVDKHLLDANVLKALKRNGSVEALVVFDGSDVRRNADIEAGKGKGRLERVKTGLTAGHKTQKAKALKGIKGVTIVDSFNGLSVANVRFTSKAGLLRVLQSGRVIGVQLPLSFDLTLQQSLGVIRQPATATLGYRGAGTTVAVLDTGVNYSTGYFGTCPTPGAAGCKIIEAHDFGSEDGKMDDNGHGTNVAGIVAGVAPDARILAYDVFVGGSADPNNVIAAIGRSISLQSTYNIRAFNLSVARKGARWTSACSTIEGGVTNPYTQIFADARSVGIVPVVSAGNDANLDNGAFSAGLAFPACTPGAVSVGAVYDANVGGLAWEECTDGSTAQDKVTCFSQSAPNLTVLAPGAPILAAGITQGGTSQAAPHVAGAVAVLSAARPGASVDGITNAIAGSGPQINDPRLGAGQKRRLDLYAAVTAITSVADTTKPVFAANPSSAIDTTYTVATNGVTAVTFAWRATDASGIARYNISLRVNGGTWVDYTSSLPTPTTEALDFNLTPGTTYEFAVIAQDKAGNWSDWRYSGAVLVGLAAENGAGVTYSTGWTRSAWASAVGGYLTVGATPNGWARYSAPANTARSIGWVATSGTNRGQAKVYLDGILVKTVELYSASTVARKVQYLTAVDPTRSHTLEIRIVGTAGRPTVDVDAFVTLR